jgi:hypothetical protein
VSDRPKIARRLAIGLAVVAFLLTRVYLLLVFKPLISDVAPVYFHYAVQGVDKGLCPYRDFGGESAKSDPSTITRSIEYPPGAWWVMAIPRLLSTRPIVTELDAKHALLPYYVGYRWLMFLADAATFALVIALVRRRRPEYLAWVLWTYLVTTTVLAHVLYDRLDMVLLLLLAIWSYAWLRPDDEDATAPAWRFVSYFVLGLSVAYKLAPLVVVPFVLLADWQATKGIGRKLLRGMALVMILVVGVLLPGLPFYREAGWGVLGFLKYHGQRPVEIESLYASLQMLLAPLGLQVHAKYDFGGWNLESSISPFLAAASTWIWLGALCSLGLWALAQRREFGRPAAWRLACFSLLMTVITAKVVSVQYLVWVIPLMLWLGAEIMSQREYVGLCGLSVLMAALTAWLFPYHFFETDTRYALTPILHPLACGVLVLRNAVLLGIVGWLGVRLAQRARQGRVVARWS